MPHTHIQYGCEKRGGVGGLCCNAHWLTEKNIKQISSENYLKPYWKDPQMVIKIFLTSIRPYMQYIMAIGA